MKRTKDFYLVLLSYALLEIRALHNEGKGGQGLESEVADMFHVVPTAIMMDWDEKAEEDLYEQIRAKAKAYGRSEQLDRWEQSALKRIKE